MTVRIATSRDVESIRDLYLRAFPESERELVAELAIQLLAEETSPQTFGLVVVKGEIVLGHIAFSPVSLRGSEGFRGYLLAPLAVDPESQKQGVGTELVEAGFGRLRAMGVDLLFVYGDPGYYGRFGFDAEIATRFLPGFDLEYPFGWLAMPLGGKETTWESGELKFVSALNDPRLW